GAQNCHFMGEGAYTGDIAPKMLLESGCQYVIIGHSERRHGLDEAERVLNLNLKSALKFGLSVIFCIGETLAEREANLTEDALRFQLDSGLSGLAPEWVGKVVVAYEPVWAIGTGKVATPEQAQEAHLFIRKEFAKKFGEAAAEALIIQYGGSVKPENAATILKQPDVDGALIGGASLKADSFLAIINAGK
ncbi:MAG: triose-phosphate isomerase, partial [Planctomycetes bacterium]|nr:triose-phosphate isomerase [Planctomycetota bacterium]